MKYVVLILIAFAVFFYSRYSNNKNTAAAVENITMGQNFLEQNKMVEGISETTSGLQYQILEHGKGVEHPTASSKVTVHYHGTLLDGTVFDSSVDRGNPITFGLNQVIKGWTEGVQLMVVGDKFKFFIPSTLGYGDKAAGKITPGSLLIFEVTLLEIK
jgi:peptidylprolyl isomerase